MKRRDALKGLGALAGTSALPKFLTGCGWERGPSQTRGITTTVVLCMENRSYDHYLGARALEGLGGNGLQAGMANPRLSGSQVEIYAETEMVVPDPPHGWTTSRGQFNEGKNDGFMRMYEEEFGEEVGPHVMGYFGRNDLPVSWALADHFATSDAWFSSLMGPTWPNRMYLHSGQSGGLNINELPTNGGINWRSIHHQLSDAGIDWGYYYQDLPFVPLYQGLDVDKHVFRVNNDFWKDAADGTLPAVTWLEPNFNLNDDHPPRAPIMGQQFIGTVYEALAQSPQWENVLFIVTYDEHGGFFDHVAPPKADDGRSAEGFDQLGFRVPSFVAGPYVKPGYVDSTVRDHTSVLKHISLLYGLEPLTERVAWAPDMFGFLDLERLERGDPRPPTKLPEVTIPGSLIDATCAMEANSQPELSALADDGLLTKWDRRHCRQEDALAVAQAAQRLGAGGIDIKR